MSRNITATKWRQFHKQIVARALKLEQRNVTRLLLFSLSLATGITKAAGYSDNPSSTQTTINHFYDLHCIEIRPCDVWSL